MTVVVIAQRRFWAALLFPWLFSACSILSPPPEPEVPLAVPEQWQQPLQQSSQQLTQPQQLVAAFADPQLEQLLEQMLAGNYQLQQAQLQVEIAASQLGIDRAALWPTLGLQFDTQRRGGDLLPASTHFSLQGLVSWEVDVWGRLGHQRAQAQASLDAAVADWQAARLSLAAQAARAWFDYVTARRQGRLADANVAALQKIENTVHKRFERGLVRLLELRVARTNLARAQSDDIAARQQIIVAKQTVHKLLGQSSEQWQAPLEVDLADHWQPLPAGLPAEVLRRRPDLVAAQRRWQAAAELWAAARKSRLPGLTLTGSIGQSSDELSDLLGSGDSSWSLAGQLLTPIFNAGKLKAQALQAQAQRDLLRYQYAETLFNALVEFNDGAEQEQLLQQQLQASLRVLDEAEATEKLALRDYGDGLTDLNTLLDAQSNAIAAQRSVLNSRNARLQNRINLLLALGGQFQPYSDG